MVEDTQESTILNRKLTWSPTEMTYEADPTHAARIREALGFDATSNGLEKPMVKETADEVQDGAREERLGPAEGSQFRSLAARVNYLALDRADVEYAAKEICRSMSAPTKASWEKLKRLARHLIEYPRLVWRCAREPDEDYNTLRVFSDSDWAGCVRTRRSTSGGVVVVACMAVKHWSTTQSTTALSVGEAEYVALVKAATEALGIQALARDLGWELKIEIGVDSSTAKSIASRSGLAK